MSQNETERRKQVIEAGRTDIDRWTDVGQLEAAWEARSVMAADLIPAGVAVLDVGCGAMKLERHLPFGVRYTPVDIVPRDERTIIVDLNAGDIPDHHVAAADIIVMLGVWEYLYQPGKLFSALGKSAKPIVCSYCPMETAGRLDRRALGWVNDFALDEFKKLAEQGGYEIAVIRRVDDLQYLFKFIPVGSLGRAPVRKRVHVISCNTVGNFGDRLGYHLLNDVLPPQAEVSWGTFEPFSPVPDNLDLLIVGIGNSLFAEILTDPLIEAVRQAKVAIGIFGTQYRDLLPRPKLDLLLGNLTHWYARYEEDINLYGRGRTNVTHLGDWLINAFPLARATDDRTLAVGREVLQQLPLDRVIQQIQGYKKVISERVHPLLCALTSAEQAGYREQHHPGHPTVVSGKFRSMLMDVFGQTFRENALWSVDRERVAAYKSRVRDNTDRMGRHLAQLLHEGGS